MNQQPPQMGGFNATFDPGPAPQAYQPPAPAYQQPYFGTYQQPYGQQYGMAYPVQSAAQPSCKGAKIALSCAGVVMIGSVAPWASVDTGFGSLTVNGTSGDGWIFIFMAVISAILSGVNITKPGQIGWPVASLCLLGLVAIFGLVDIGNIASIGDYYYDAVTVSWGLLLVLLAGIGGVVGSIIQISGRKG